MRQVRAVTTTLFLLLLSSCFTLGLWGFEPKTERNVVTGKTETSFAYDSDTEWSWSLFFQRLLWTPVTLAVDCLTAPVQAWLFDDDDDSDDDDGKHGQRCRH